MVNNLHDFFATHCRESVIDTGHGVEENHTPAVDATAHNAPRVFLYDGNPKAGQQYHNAQCATYNMSDHVGNFLATGIVGQESISQFCSFHVSASLHFLPTNYHENREKPTYDSIP